MPPPTRSDVSSPVIKMIYLNFFVVGFQVTIFVFVNHENQIMKPT